MFTETITGIVRERQSSLLTVVNRFKENLEENKYARSKDLWTLLNLFTMFY